MTSDYAPTPVEDFLDPDHPTLFPRLTSEQIEYLGEIGTEHSYARGDLVFEHGQRETPLYVVRSGAVDIIDQAPETIRDGLRRGDCGLSWRRGMAGHESPAKAARVRTATSA